MQPTSELLNLNNAQIVVTGASGTIGRGIAKRLVSAGAKVAVHYQNNKQAIDTLLSELGDAGIAVQGDLSVKDGVDAIFTQLEQAQFSPTAIVNNAADQSIANLQDMSLEQWRQMMAANLDSIFLIGKWAAVNLSNGGAIVNISSIESLDPAQSHGHYASSKAALNMLTRAHALEFGDLNIRVNSVSPGLIRRDGIEQAWPEGVARWQDRAPQTRLGEAEDVANAVLFLLSDAARWITGTNLVVDGGMTAQSKW